MILWRPVGRFELEKIAASGWREFPPQFPGQPIFYPVLTLRSGDPQFEVTGAFRERLASIKRGDVALDDVIAEAEAMTPALEEARHATRLPKSPDFAVADALLRRIGHESARRFVLQEPGSFGA